MKGTELRKAYEAIDKVNDIAYYRPETAHRAVGAVLSVLGARRLLRASSDGTDGAMERRYLRLLSTMEDAAVRLDAIPTQTNTADDRAKVWDEILKAAAQLRKMLMDEQRMTRASARRTA